MIKNRMMKKLSAGFMAGLCAFSMLGSTLNGTIPANAASVSTTENAAFPSADKVIAQAATLLGTPYNFGFKGFTGVYYQDSYKPLDLEYVRNQGLDCSGLVYYTLTHLGYKTSGFSWNNPVPVDTTHWLTVNDNCTISYGGVTSKIDVEKAKISTEERPYWECADGSTITPGSVVVAEMPDSIDHAWIYMGEFNSRADVVTYLKNIGVPETLITAQTVGNGSGDGGKHWRIESNGSQGVVINNNTDGKKATVMTMSAFRITQTDVTFSLLKVDKDTQVLIGKSPVDNSTAVYGVYTDKGCTNKVAEITIGDNGRGSVKLLSGTYYAKEIKAPTGYALDETVYTLSAGNTVTVPEEVLDGTIKINKTAEDGIVAGREFKVVGSDGKSYTSTTNASGIAEFTDLPVYDMTTGKEITYTISEINVETRYETPKAQNVTLTSGSVDLTVTANFVNELKTGSIRINKQSEDNQNGDRTFTITGNGETYTITTGADGIAILSDIPVYNSENEKIEYTISEKDVPIRYVVPANQTATLTADATVDVTFENVLKKFTVEVVKKDIENGTAQGDASLAGAVYGIYNGDELIDTYTTDEYGSFTTHEFECGENWTIKELTPSEGYLLDSTVYEVGAEEKKYTIENNAIEMTVYETPVKGKISIIKHSDDGTTGIETPEVGAEFEVYLKSAGSYENAMDSERDHLICDENGFAQTKMLPYGIYVVHQTVGWDNTEWVDDFEVNVCENEEDYFYIINDAVLTSYVKIVKKDAETGNIIPVAGIGFKVWNCDTESYVVQTVNYPTPTEIDTFYTDETGTLMLPNELVYGNYELHEVQSANGYVLDSKPVPFTIDGTVDTVVVEKTNKPQKGKISVQKSGDVFTSVIAGETTYTPVFEETGLAGAVFEITAAEDIVTADGTIRAKKGDVVATLTTDDNGYAESDLLYLGKYEVKEIKAPYGYVQNAVSETVELTYTYDGMDGLTKVVYPDGSYVAYTYDDSCRLTSVSTAYGTTSYEYDKLDRLVRVVDRNGYATVYEYDANGNRSAVKYANGIVVSYDYDEVNRLILEKALDKQGGLVAQYEYTLGAAGERTAVKELNRTVEYTYDALYRLTSEKIAAADGTVTTYTYAYDKVSNCILKTENGAETVYTYNALNQLTAENDITYVYDAAGNLISAASPTKSTLYVYNAENKQIRATVQEGDETSVEEYEYDYAGNRTVKKSEGEYTYYLNDISGSLTQVLAEIDADGNEKCWNTRGIELISQERSGLVSYYLIDGHGSVRQLADTAGTVTDTYVYDAWGNLISSTGETENSYLYCGEQLDSTTGLYYLRARYMNPTTGTFITQDTYAGTIFDPTSLHKYLYANANPVMNVDPSGNMAQAVMVKAEAQHNTWALVTYHKLKATLKTVCATHVKSNLVNIVAGTLAVSVLGKASQMLNDLIVISAASGFTIGQSKNANVYTIASWMVGLLLTAAQDVKNSGRNINLPKVIHHIVQQKFWFAKPAQAVLIESGVNPCIGYTTSQLRAAEKLGEPNLTEIKALTHFAIHSQLCNTPYTAWVNLIIVATPHHSDVGLANYLAVASSLALIEGTIKSVDAIL